MTRGLLEATNDEGERSASQTLQGTVRKPSLPKGKPKAQSSPIPIAKLTHKQDSFARMVAQGKTLSDAYRASYTVSPETLEESIWQTASKLAKHPKVLSRINSLKAVVINEEWQDMGKLRALALKTLETEAKGLGEDTKSSSRISAAVAIGKLTEVDLFTDHKVIEHRDDSRLVDLKVRLEQRLTALLNKAQSSPVAALTRQMEPDDEIRGVEDPTHPGTPV